MMVGQTAGSYKILEKLGEGGMGAVYKGIDIMLEREVAIKVLRPELAHQQDVVERFRSEAILLARLNHPNIATLYSFQRQGDDLLMVMEFVRGEPLEEHLKRLGRMSPERAVSLFSMALNGIEHAHQMGIVHRDIKPANVMLTHDGSVKVMDFGIARALGAARMTRTGRLIGTLEYMAPEQVRGEAGDTRSDIYALGILLYEMLTGKVPFESDSDYGLMRAQIEMPPPPPRVIAPKVPEGIEAAVLRALEKDPDARFQAVAAFREQVEAGLRVKEKPREEAETKAPPPTRIASLADAGPADGREVEPKETRVAGAQEVAASLAGEKVPKSTRIAGSGDASGAQGLKGTRLAVPEPGAESAPAPLMTSLTQQARGLLERLAWPHYAGVVALLLVAILLIVAWPDGTPPVNNEEVNPNTEEVIADGEDPSDNRVRRRDPPPLLQDPNPQPPDDSQQLVAIQDLLAQAQRYFDADQLTTPEGENALDYARRVLVMDPLNVEAKTLITAIAARYEQWGDARMLRGEYEQALTYFERSLAVDYNNPDVERKAAEARGALSDQPPVLGDESAVDPGQTTDPLPLTPERRTVSLPSGTRVRVRLEETLAAVNGSNTGDAVRLTVVENVVVDGMVLIGKGARAMGTITHVRRARTLLRGELRFSIRSVKAVDGTDISLRSEEFETKAARGRDAFVQKGGVYSANVARSASIRTR
ncbi:MAG: protein kinase [Rhodothermales bacterium]